MSDRQIKSRALRQNTHRSAAITVAVVGLFASNLALAQTTQVAKKIVLSKPAQTVAPTGVVLSDIVVQGLQRSDPATVFNLLPVKIGDSFNKDKTSDIVKALNASGLYQSVDVDLKGSVLVLNVVERSVISDIAIKGMKKFDRKQILSGLKAFGFAPGYPYDPAMADKIKEQIVMMYAEAGLLNAKVSVDVTQQDRKQVAVTINVNEGKSIKVKEITITGNKQVSTYKIRSIMDLDVNGLFSWYSKDSLFTREKLNADIENIRAHYYDLGFLDFDFASVETPPIHEGSDVAIRMAVKEGEPYRVKSVRLDGITKDTSPQILEKIVKEYPINSIYSRTKMSKILQKITERLGKDGYALAKVDVVPSLDKVNHVVDVVISVDAQERAYVRHVNINGNSRTKDQVIRREVRQMESALYSGDDVQLSRDRIDRLGFFSEVVVDVVPVEGTNNQVDVNYTVKENPTGDLKLGVGYSTTDSVSVSGSINERNFMGSGNSLGVSIDTSKSTRNASVDIGNPYFTKSGISSNFSGYYKTYDSSKLNVSDTKYTTIGLSANFGVPISEKHRLFFGFNPEANKIRLGVNAPESYVSQNYGTGYIKTYETSIGWSYDTRDSGFQPTKGSYQRASLAASLLGDVKYYRGTYQFQYFAPMSKNITLALNTQFDYGAGMNGKAYPYFRNIYAGGLGSIRGFDSSSVGPSQLTNGSVSYVGGSKRAIANVELQFPFPGMAKSRDVRLFVFADAGGLWTDKKISGADASCDYSKISVSGCNGLRYSYGLGVLWRSPIGPLKFSYGLPINKRGNDKEQRFQFQIGTSF